MADQHPFAQRWNADTQYYPRIADLLEGHDVVLDAGCGEGTLARYLASSEAAFGQGDVKASKQHGARRRAVERMPRWA